MIWSSDFPNRDDFPSSARTSSPARQKRERLLAAEIYIPPAPYDPHAGRVRILLAYPNTYHVGMSNLGFLYLYRILNEHPDIACERAFYEDGLTRRSFETASDPGRFDAILFTLPFEMDAPNIIRFLRDNGIPPQSSARRSGKWPLILIGGSAPTLNPRFLLPFADAVFAGDVEPVFDDLASALSSIRAGGRESALGDLETIPGIVTLRRLESGRPIDRPEVVTPRGCFNTVATPYTEFSRSILIEVERGCPFKCRFCTVGYDRKNIVEMPTPEIAALVRQAEIHGLRIGMIGSALLSSKIWKTDRRIWDESPVDFTFASLRADKLNAENLRALSRRRRSLTLAPEVGTMRMMNLINKRMDLSAARSRLAQARNEGIEQVKLYFIYGFPFEMDADVQGIIDFCADAVGTGLRVKVSLNPFIPKPQTPLQWFPMQPLKILKSKFRFLRDGLRGLGVRDVSGYSPREAIRQAWLIFSDETAELDLLSASETAGTWGAGSESETPTLEAPGALTRCAEPALGAPGLSKIFAQKPFDEPFPWDILRTSVSKDELRAHARAILESCAPVHC